MEPTELYAKFEEYYRDLVLPYIKKSFPKNIFTMPIWEILERFHWRRFRSGIPLLFADAYDIPKKDILPLAAASEIIFGISLIQDDIIDRDIMRGEFPAAHITYGVSYIVAACDNAYGHVYEMLKNYPSEILKQFNNSQKELYRSFMIELNNKGNIDFSIESIKDVYYKKTVTGINALYCTTLLCKKAPNDFASTIMKYCKLLSIAGQIKNDIYDLVSWQKYPETRGYSDIKNSYMTYAIRKLIDISTPKDKAPIKKAIINANEKVVLKYIEKYDIINKCIKDGKEYANKAKCVIEGKYPEVTELLIAWAEGHGRFNKI